MFVDPEVLRLFAAEVDTAAGTVATADVGGKIEVGCDVLAGSTTQFTVQAIGTYVAGLVTGYSAQIAAMGTSVGGVAGDFTAEDEAVAQSFDQVWRDR